MIHAPIKAARVVLDADGPRAARIDESNLRERGFIRTAGRPRYASLRGRHFATAFGIAWPCDTMEEALEKRDNIIAERRERRG